MNEFSHSSPNEPDADAAAPHRVLRISVAARGALALIRWYQRFLSPALPPTCRFHPTCSHYGLQALERFGFWRGGLLTAWRILRCNPFCKGGYDPVPGGNDERGMMNDAEGS